MIGLPAFRTYEPSASAKGLPPVPVDEVLDPMKMRVGALMAQIDRFGKTRHLVFERVPERLPHLSRGFLRVFAQCGLYDVDARMPEFAEGGLLGHDPDAFVGRWLDDAKAFLEKRGWDVDETGTLPGWYAKQITDNYIGIYLNGAKNMIEGDLDAFMKRVECLYGDDGSVAAEDIIQDLIDWGFVAHVD